MKKHILISMAGATLLSLGLLSINSTNVNAAVKVGQSSRLTHNSYVYNGLGMRAHKSSLKRGRLVYVLGKKTINGKVYVRIGKNQYVRLSNFSRAKSSSNKPTGILTHNSYVYNKNGVRISRQSLKKNKIVSLFGLKTINGKKYYQIGKNRFVKAGNVSESLPNNDENRNNSANVNNTNSNNSSSNTTNTNNSSNTDNSNPVTNNNSNNNSNSNSSNTQSRNNNSSQNDDSDDSQLLTLKHNAFVVDKSGTPKLGMNLGKGTQVHVDKSDNININNQTYYSCYIGDDDASNLGYVEGYIKANAFEDNGTDASFDPATPDDLVDLRKWLDQNFETIDNLESNQPKDIEEAVRQAYYQAEEVSENGYSSEKDIDTVKSNLISMFKEYKPKTISVNGTYNTYTLNEDQKNQIKKIVQEMYGIKNINDIKFLKDGKTISFIYNSALKTISANNFVTPTNK